MSANSGTTLRRTTGVLFLVGALASRPRQPHCPQHSTGPDILRACGCGAHKIRGRWQILVRPKARPAFDACGCLTG